MFTESHLGAFSWWHYLFDERIEILMAMEINVFYWLGCPWHSPTEWFLSKWPVWALLMNINVELCPFLRQVSSSLPLQLFCRHKSTLLKSDIIIFSSFTADRSLQPVIYQSPVVSQAKLPCVFNQIYWLWCLKIYFEDDLWVCFLMRHSMGQFCLAQCFIKGGRWLFIYLYTVLMIQCIFLQSLCTLFSFLFFFFLEFTNSFKEIFHLQISFSV